MGELLRQEMNDSTLHVYHCVADRTIILLYIVREATLSLLFTL